MYYMTLRQRAQLHDLAERSLRPGDNLFASTMVAVDAETGEYKWHYQSIHHDVWDMDNVHPPTLADIEVDGEERQGRLLRQQVRSPVRARPHERRARAPRGREADDHRLAPEPRPRPSPSPRPGCCRSASCGRSSTRTNIPGDPWRAVPNYNGYQPDADGNLVFNPDSYVAVDEPFLTYPDGHPVGPPPGLHVRPAVGSRRSSRPPARTAAPTGRTTRTATARTSSTTRTAPTRWRTATALAPTASGPSGSTRPAASSPTTPRPARSRGATTSARTCRTARDR